MRIRHFSSNIERDFFNTQQKINGLIDKMIINDFWANIDKNKTHDDIAAIEEAQKIIQLVMDNRTSRIDQNNLR